MATQEERTDDLRGITADRDHGVLGPSPDTGSTPRVAFRLKRPGPTQPTRRRLPGRIMRRRAGIAIPAYFLVPALAFYAFDVLIPSGRGLFYAFTNWDGLNPHFQIVGLQNFRTVASDPAGRSAVLHTLLLGFAVTAVQVTAGLLLALGVWTRVRSRNLLRVVFFSPVVMTPVVTAFVWQYLLSPDGVVDGILSTLGWHGSKPGWLGDPGTALWTIAGIVVWQYSGITMAILLAGLEGISPDILEAAELDGANAWARFRYIIRPSLAPALTVSFVLALTTGLKLFDQVWVTTQGGPANSTETITTLMYRDAFQYGQFGYSMSLAIVLFMLVSVVTGIQYGVLRRAEG